MEEIILKHARAAAVSLLLAAALFVLFWNGPTKPILDWISNFQALLGAFLGVLGAYWIAAKRKRDEEKEEQTRIIQSFTADFINAQNQMIIYFNAVDDALDGSLTDFCKELKFGKPIKSETIIKKSTDNDEEIRKTFFEVSRFIKIANIFTRYNERRKFFDRINHKYFIDFIYLLHLFEEISHENNIIHNNKMKTIDMLKFFINFRYIISYNIYNSSLHRACKEFDIKIEKLRGSMLIRAQSDKTPDSKQRLI